MDYSQDYGAFFSVPFILFSLAVCVFTIICHWKVYQKAGYKGWECIIPIYNIYILLKIVGKPWWWLILFCIPFVNIIFAIWTTNLLSLSFGKSTAFTLGLIFLSIIFVAILAFDRTVIYRGPAGNPDVINPLDDINSIGKKAV
ncbi:DUF5684 domain-containing protein [Chitinophaga solisilvae]|uniref:DUF5684 domain-containing protein n=1 Tax=Chitinophaga solisilvae TaxID=1233460 RepID=UPI0019215C01|nr:DUF5684 domain-containing protein [Chitinophaga solisilvae]